MNTRTRKSRHNAETIIDLTGDSPAPLRKRKGTARQRSVAWEANNEKKTSDVSCQTDPQNEVPFYKCKTKSSLGDCPICLEELGSNLLASTFCGHIFCLECIQRALEQNKHCPTCRASLGALGVHVLYVGNVQEPR